MLAAGLLNMLLTYLFYDSMLFAGVCLPVSLMYLYEWQRECIRKKELQFRAQFQNSIQIMSSLLRTGYSVENAIRETEKELRPLYAKESRIRKEYEQMGRELEMNLPTEKVLGAFAGRVQQEDVDQFVTVFASAKRLGGDSISIMRETIQLISGKTETEREIETILAGKKMEFRLMCIIPLGMVFYMRLAFPEFLSVLYGNPAGVLLMSICLGMYIFAYWLGNKIIRIEV